MGLRAIIRQPSWLNFELTNQGRMIGEFDLGDLKVADFYLRAMEDVIQLSARRSAGV
jgi:hypothetical protein